MTAAPASIAALPSRPVRKLAVKPQMHMLSTGQ